MKHDLRLGDQGRPLRGGEIGSETSMMRPTRQEKKVLGKSIPGIAAVGALQPETG